jgi:hypothetical protein
LCSRSEDLERRIQRRVLWAMGLSQPQYFNPHAFDTDFSNCLSNCEPETKTRSNGWSQPQNNANTLASQANCTLTPHKRLKPFITNGAGSLTGPSVYVKRLLRQVCGFEDIDEAKLASWPPDCLPLVQERFAFLFLQCLEAWVVPPHGLKVCVRHRMVELLQIEGTHESETRAYQSPLWHIHICNLRFLSFLLCSFFQASCRFVVPSVGH